ncbi:hypothetical protein BGZ89_000627 [Linnemannia elongata]|nr:hypothetical protein BGZ89_000627 [Linnemannia elongata]
MATEVATGVTTEMLYMVLFEMLSEVLSGGLFDALSEVLSGPLFEVIYAVLLEVLSGGLALTPAGLLGEPPSWEPTDVLTQVQVSAPIQKLSWLLADSSNEEISEVLLQAVLEVLARPM